MPVNSQIDVDDEELDIKEPDFINEFAIIGDFGFARHEGPWEVQKNGTVWLIIMPFEDINFQISKCDEGYSAALVADGQIVGGGIISEVYEPEAHEFHVFVDQYEMGEVEI